MHTTLNRGSNEHLDWLIVSHSHTFEFGIKNNKRLGEGGTQTLVGSILLDFYRNCKRN